VTSEPLLARPSALPPPDVAVVIVNWNAGDLLRHCLDSLASPAAGSPSHEIIVVDNGSTDDSVAACRGRADVTVIENGRNLGFGAACNIGARHARAPMLLFLNPDCVVGPGSIERCLAEFAHADVGVCGVALTDERGAVWRSCARFPSAGTFVRRILGLHVLSPRFSDGPMNDWDHLADADVDHVIGAFYMMRRGEFERIGGFDERFFVYLEDLDLSLRVRQAGLRVRFLAAPPSFHAGGGVSRKIKARRVFYATRSRILYAYKHFPAWQAHGHLALTLLVEPLTRLVFALLQRSASAVGETVGGFGMVWRDLPHTMRAARRP
jgi:GT2 family glycosyltransferase